MVLPKQKFREVVFQLLYSFDFVKIEDDEEIIPFLMHQLKITKKSMKEAQERIHLVQEKEKEIDLLITHASQGYSFERITRVEKNILRLGCYEMLFDESIPPKVAMTEAVRLARKFATPEGGAFVNGVLDAIFSQKEVKDDSTCTV